jgi:hypothetical protein
LDLTATRERPLHILIGAGSTPTPWRYLREDENEAA